MNIPNYALSCSGHGCKIFSFAEKGGMGDSDTRIFHEYIHSSESGPDNFRFAKVLPLTNLISPQVRGREPLPSLSVNPYPWDRFNILY